MNASCFELLQKPGTGESSLASMQIGKRSKRKQFKSLTGV
jgi:hypothetical protein